LTVGVLVELLELAWVVVLLGLGLTTGDGCGLWLLRLTPSGWGILTNRKGIWEGFGFGKGASGVVIWGVVAGGAAAGEEEEG
jgi:hypothetical protein